MNDPPESGLQPKPPLLDELRGLIQAINAQPLEKVKSAVV
jgi:hypothetical protein